MSPRVARLRVAADDVRILGRWAPLRAAYEVVKRSGGHRVLFTSIARRPVPRVQATSPFPAPSRDEIPVEARQRCLADAAEIAAGRLRLFGTVLPGQTPPEWHSVIHRPGRWAPVPWWEIDLRSAARAGDVKWVWELGRHRHLVVLARAAFLEPQERRWLAALTAQLRSWLAANPPELGVHWYSNLEISLRSLAWLQVLGLVGDELEPGLRTQMSQVLYRSGRHLVADLPYTLSSMRNNHLLGDGLGLAALGRSFASVPAAARWARLGDRLFVGQLQRHVNADGSMIEDSVSYHRFVLEMLAMRVALGGAAVAERHALRTTAQFLCRLGVLEGQVPAYGDWDEGRVLAGSADPLDLAGSARVALSLAGDGSPPDWRRDHDEVAWYSRPGDPVPPDAAERGGHALGGGITRVSVGPFDCWLKAGSAPSHGHGDLCSVAVSLAGAWVVGDPGTGNYNSDPVERDYFRSSAAHSVLRIDGEDQLVAQRPFRWRYSASGAIGAPLKVPGGVVAWGWHDAYARLAPPRRVCRAILLGDDGLLVADWVEGSAGCGYEMSLPLGPGVAWNDGAVTMPDGTALRLTIAGMTEAIEGRAGSVPGGWSPTYGEVLPSTVLRVRGRVDGPVVWHVGLPGRPAAFSVDGGRVVDGQGRSLAVEWRASAPRLVVGDGR